MKKSLAAPALAASLLTLALTGCSGQPGSADDLVKVVEEAGFSCTEPAEKNGSVQSECGGVDVLYWENPEDELATHGITGGMLSDYRQTEYLIRGKQWWIIGDESSVSKVADSMDEDYDTIGY
ncbi:hypothetical protein AB0K08_05970 [Citricoccus sp. NPDC055426]|uniref:hypothetical protein n=1 Tax=Citricoccus sp. NPDC055426 TaxID=3155536 RepID=UPI00343122F6